MSAMPASLSGASAPGRWAPARRGAAERRVSPFHARGRFPGRGGGCRVGVGVSNQPEAGRESGKGTPHPRAWEKQAGGGGGGGGDPVTPGSPSLGVATEARGALWAPGKPQEAREPRAVCKGEAIDAAMERGPGPAVLVTSRPLENTHTGLDLSVPAFQLIRGKMLSGHAEYNIVVVAQLAAFKSAKHKPEDVVQFMVSKSYSEIEEFYQKLVARYPQTSLPPLPRKVMFVSETEIRDRRAAFDKVMRAISKEPGLATSPELLEFLGTRSTGTVDVKSKNLPDEEEDTEDAFRIGPFSSEDVTAGGGEEKELEEEEEEEEEDDDVDPLGVLKSKKIKKSKQSRVQKEKPKLTIFDDEVGPGEGLFGSSNEFPFGSNKRVLATRGHDLKLFEDPDLGERVTRGDPLLLPSACAIQESTLSSRVEEDMDELLRVEEDFEKMWKMSSQPQKPKPPPKPVRVPTKKPTEAAAAKLPLSPGQRAQRAEVKIDAMGEVDILKYIQENESVGSEEPSLF